MIFHHTWSSGIRLSGPGQ